MASPAIFSNQAVSAGYTKVPNSFIEHQYLFKLPASHALALMVFRRQNNTGESRTISDLHWEKWTGLKARQKDYAIKELQPYGLTVDGRGDTAKFSWDWDQWTEALKTKPAVEYDPKRKEREEREAARPKVHPDCEGGCMRLKECGTTGTNNKESPFLVTNIAQPVAQTVEQASERAWALTLAALRSFFPLIELIFLSRLINIVRGHFTNISDAELAEAVRIAYVPTQKSAGLFLWRVPLALKLIRRRAKVEQTTPLMLRAPADAERESLTRMASDERESPEMREIARHILARKFPGAIT